MYHGSAPPKTHVVACKVIQEELAEFLPPAIGVTVIEAFLHRNPAELAMAIQAAVDKIPGHIETVIVAYGLCAKAVVGLQARNFTLVIPKIDDCLALMLGSRQAYTDCSARHPGSYFLSRGWLKSGINMLEDYAEHERRFGEKKARRIHEQMFAHYDRVVFIQTGQNWQEYERDALSVADFCGWRFESLKGRETLLRKLALGPYDEDDFVIVSPGGVAKIEDFLATDGAEKPCRP